VFFRKAKVSDVPAIKSLWKSVFLDSELFINHFIEHFGIGGCHVCEINDKIVAMAFALPTTLTYPTSPIHHSPFSVCPFSLQPFAWYIYACATHPQYRRQGVMEKLLETVYDEACRENVEGIFLRAADEKLENYYRKLGFVAFFRGERMVFMHKEHQGAKGKEMRNIAPEKYYEKRILRLDKFCFVNWDIDFFKFLYETGTQFYEYENVIFSIRTICEKIIVDEWLGDSPDMQVINIILEQFPDCKTVEIHTSGNEHCCGQVKWCKPSEKNYSNGYFAFGME